MPSLARSPPGAPRPGEPSHSSPAPSNCDNHGVPVLEVTTSTATCPIHIGAGALARLPSVVQALPGAVSTIVVVTSPAIERLWAHAVVAPLQQAGYPVHVLRIPAGEGEKRLSTLETLCEQMAVLGADRDTLLIALGGGVLGDITGFLAAIYMRGLRVVQLPTTLLAQVDSSVGGKTGVNLAAGKNLVGSFHPPVAVIADIDTLATLPPRELRAGLQESVKSAIIRDASLFDFLESQADRVLAGDPSALAHVVEASVRIKAAVVAADEFETGERAILNFGHTIGHAIEAATHYTALLHGEAIGWGMIAAVRLAQARRALAPTQAARIVALVHRYTALPAFQATAGQLVALTARDKKKRSGVLKFVLPTGIGSVALVSDVTEAELQDATERMLAEVHAAVTV